jgi:hypothetical protein
MIILEMGKTITRRREVKLCACCMFTLRQALTQDKGGNSRKEDAENQPKPKTCWFCTGEGHVQNDCSELKALQKLAGQADDSASRSLNRSRSSSKSSKSSSSRKDTAEKLKKHMKKPVC